MPHIQFELDAMELVPSVAGAAGVTEAAIGWGLPKLWRHCWRAKSDVVTPIQVAGIFGGGEPARLCSALEGFGFLEARADGSFRVRGAARYLNIAKSRSDGGKKRAASAQRDGRGRLTGQSDQLLELAESPAPDQLPTSSGPALTAISDQRSASKDLSAIKTSAVQDDPQDKPRTRKKSDAVQEWEWAMSERAKLTDTREAKPSEKAINIALAPILLELGRPGFRAAYRAFLADAYPARQATPFPWGLFVSQALSRYRQSTQAAMIQGTTRAVASGFRVVTDDVDPHRVS